MTILHVGNLSSKTTASDLETLFSPFGEISSIRVACNSAGHARGFALIELDNRGAALAFQTLKGKELRGKTMSVAMNPPLLPPKRRSSHSARKR